MNNRKKLFIIRGIPGAGKSTLANIIADKVCTTDDYYIMNDEYKFDVNKINNAHNWCKRKCRHYMKIGIPKLAVANTSSRKKEFQYYIDLAKEYGYEIHSIIVENRHEGETLHNVPEENIKKMKNRFEIKLR